MNTDAFPTPTRSAGLLTLDAFVDRAGQQYANRRNFDLGRNKHDAVSRLSAWLRHRLVLEQEVVKKVLEHHTPETATKFIQEICWRTYWKGWLERRPHIFAEYQQSLQAQLARLERDTELSTNLSCAESANTGIECFDYWVKELTETGYLHNHARMWFASIWIFTLALPWQLGADFFLRHLIDGDAAANTLSWRWVAGLQTKGKHYLATAQNIDQFTEGRFNPVGQLNESAESLTYVDPGPAGPSPSVAVADVDDSTALLITDDDLAPETFLRHNVPVIGYTSTANRSPRAVAAAVKRFASLAMDDTLARQRSDTNAVYTEADDVLAWCDQNSIRRIVVSHVPIGPSRYALDALRPLAAKQGIVIVTALRDWDRALWQHADRGFFQFRKHIPNQIAALTTSSV